jgi:hypothetical protein
VDIVTISKRLGTRAKPDITLRIHAHLFKKDDSKAAAAINAALSRQGANRVPNFAVCSLEDGAKRLILLSRGHVAEWLRNGLQNRVPRFNSGRGLQLHQSTGKQHSVTPPPPVRDSLP